MWHFIILVNVEIQHLEKMYNFFESPNKWIGRRGKKPEAIVIHITQGAFKGALSWLTNPASQVSAHFLISEVGEIAQLVKCENTAWHAGVVVRPTWPLIKQGINPNFYTLGIELAGFPNIIPSMAQIIACARLAHDLTNQFSIPIDNQHIIPHNSINGAKSCPGPNINIAAIIYLASLAG